MNLGSWLISQTVDQEIGFADDSPQEEAVTSEPGGSSLIYGKIQVILRYSGANGTKTGSGKWVAAASLGIGGELTPLCGDVAHRVTEPSIVRSKRFRHLVASLCVRPALFRRHGHNRPFRSLP